MGAIYEGLRESDIDSSMITQLSLLKKFKLFITTSCDRKLEDLLGDKAEALVRNHTVNTPLQLNFSNNKQKIVYLFGRIRKEFEPDTSISFSDVDQIECVYNLSLTNTKNSSIDNYSFLEYLKGKTLLFIGNNFQDWFIRFAIRILSNAPYNNIIRKVYIINDSNRKLNFEEFFFRRFEIQLVHDSPIQDFITNLCNVIHQDEQVKLRFGNKQVFISYDRDDAQQATALYNQLRNRGVNAWLDTSDLGPGEHKEEIRKYIQSTHTAIFICLLSKTLMDKADADSYVKYHEWKIAESRTNANKFMKERGDVIEEFTILPVAIDDFTEYVNKLPDFIKNNTIYKADDLNLLPFVENLLK
jgi:hypothetical protein